MKHFRPLLLATTAISALSLSQPSAIAESAALNAANAFVVAQAAPDQKEAPKAPPKAAPPAPPKVAPPPPPHAPPPAPPKAPPPAPPRAAPAPAHPAPPPPPAARPPAPPAAPHAAPPAAPKAGPAPQQRAPEAPKAAPAAPPAPPKAAPAAPQQRAPEAPKAAPGAPPPPAPRGEAPRRPDNAPPIPPGVRDVTPPRPAPGATPPAARPGTPPTAPAAPSTAPGAPKAAPNAVTTPPGAQPLPGATPPVPNGAKAPNAAPGTPPAPGAAPATPPAGPGARSERRGPPPGMPAGTPAAPATAPVAAPLPAAPAVTAAPIPANAPPAGARRMEDFRNQRQQTTEGGRTIIREPGRVIIKDPNGQAFVRHNDIDRFRYGARDVRVSRDGNDTRTVVVRPDGSQIITINDDRGGLLRRIRRDRDGREIVIIDNRRHGGPGFGAGLAAGMVAGAIGGYFVSLPPPVLHIPQDRYIVEADGAPPDLIYDTLVAPPVDRLERAYSLDEIRYSPSVRQRMPSIDLDTINFETGSWDIPPDQAAKLQVLADGMNRAIQRNPQTVFLIEGHTDAVGNDVDNLSLSDRRAEAAATLLTQQFGVPAENLTAQGYGEQYLKVQTDGAERRNRRVTIRNITPLLNGGEANAAPR
ncbi:MAG: OmpA family protein [Afipia sp.]|nr:OmpA family protein [Afipia sp.]OJW63247.1 MAG: hypothetical protein BGO65_06780 [Afipia sp. 64-13]